MRRPSLVDLVGASGRTGRAAALTQAALCLPFPSAGGSACESPLRHACIDPLRTFREHRGSVAGRGRLVGFASQEVVVVEVVQSSSPGVSAEELASLSSPDRLETPFGTMEFFDGVPLPDDGRASYDALDLLRGDRRVLELHAGGVDAGDAQRACASVGARSNVIACTDPRSTSAPVVLTANTETTYGTTFLDLKTDGPTVIECPPNSLSFVDDLWQRYVADMGNAGPDRGQGGKYLFLPPGHDGEVPDGYFVFQSPTYSNWVVIRALDGLDALLTTRIYPLAAADDPPETGFVDFAEASFNGIHANDFSFFEEVNEIVQEEPEGALDPERAGQLAAIGIVRGRPFEPDARLRDILEQAARIGAGHRPHPAVQAARPRRLHLRRRARGRPRSSAAATSSSPTAPGCSTTAA